MATGPVLATFLSKSNPSADPYEVRLGKDGNVYCTCPGWRYQSKHPHDRVCCHMKELAQQMGTVASKLSAKVAEKKAAPAPAPKVAAKVETPKPVEAKPVEVSEEAEVAALEKPYRPHPVLGHT